MSGKPSILLLTEDTGSSAHKVLRAVAEKLLFATGAAFDPSQIEFERDDERAREALSFNPYYKSTKPKDHGKQLDLATVIATKLLRPGVEAFVFVHLDGDRRWSERDQHGETLCDNHAMFARNILRRVHALLEKHGHPERLERVLPVLPFWSIEAWLYQNTREVQRLCTHHSPRHDSDQPKFKEWADAPQLLDETPQPKLQVPTFKDTHNLDLARTLPARKLLTLELSFADTVKRLRRCAPLTGALASIQHHS